MQQDHDDGCGSVRRDSPPTDLRQFVCLANSLVERIETAKRELERDREAANASLATASAILQSEIARCRREHRPSWRTRAASPP